MSSSAFVANPKMEYRRLGRSGLRVSVLSFGSWVTFDNQLKDDLALECMQAAWDAGCNFFDNAEAYAGGESEAIMGRVIRELGWRRHDFVLSTKVFWGIDPRIPNMNNTLNRKYLHHSIEGCLDRLQVDFVDILFCHRADPNTPLEETVWAMSDLVDRGKTLYWGTSEWTADEIRAAWEIAERHHLHKPVTEQPQYNMLERRRVEVEYRRLYDDIGLGTTIWSPLASGLLTGKYLDGVPDDSRGALPGYAWLAKRLTDVVSQRTVKSLAPIAVDLGCSMAQLALAWCTKNAHVSTVITGASRPSQVVENFGALDVIELLTDDVMDRISAVLADSGSISG
jgi:voltage-dependent potassium channel beta subunit